MKYGIDEELGFDEVSSSNPHANVLFQSLKERTYRDSNFLSEVKENNRYNSIEDKDESVFSNYKDLPARKILSSQ